MNEIWWLKYKQICLDLIVYGADGAVHGTIRTVHTTHAAAPKTRCREPYAAA